jgi:hypothetical protein
MSQLIELQQSKGPIIDPASLIKGAVIPADVPPNERRRFLDRRLPEVEVFEHRDFNGDHWRTSFGYSYVGDDWQDRISSIIVYSGFFQFFEDVNFGSSTFEPVTLGVGQYAFVEDFGIRNDTITSWKAFFE